MFGRRDDERRARLLAALADGSISATKRRRALVEAAASPTARRMLHEQQYVHHALKGGAPVTPSSLHARLVGQATRRQGPARRAVDRLALAGAVALAAIVVLVSLSFALRPGAASTVADVARPSALSATASAPMRDPRRPALLRASFAGVTYPDWAPRFGWRATGQRRDAIHGRMTTTVFYQHTHHRIGYTVVSGQPLKPAAGAQRVVINGLELRAYKDHARDVVSFTRNGHTCVLAGKVHFRSTLLRLASWKAEGAISF